MCCGSDALSRRRANGVGHSGGSGGLLLTAEGVLALQAIIETALSKGDTVKNGLVMLSETSLGLVTPPLSRSGVEALG